MPVTRPAAVVPAGAAKTAMRLDPAHSEERYVERPSNPLRFDPEGTRPGMFDPAARIDDESLEEMTFSASSMSRALSF